MKSDAYWKRRAEQRMYEYIQEADRVADEVGKAYLQAAGYLEAQAKKIFDTYRKRGGLSEAEARRLLNDVGNATDYDALKKAYNRVKDPDLKQTLLNQLNAPAYRARIERLKQLREDLDRKCRELYKIETKAADEHLAHTAQNAYYRTMYDIQTGTGYGFGFAQISEQGVNEILRNNWSGASYSSRIWSNTQTVAELIKNELFLGVLAGKSQHEMSAAIMEKMGVGAMQARRLVRTESCYVANQAEMESYKECEIEKYRFVATLDLRTSEICAGLDGKEFPVDKQQPNVNCPPMHPNCRSTTIAVFDAEIMEGMQRRAVDPETGKDIFVPADMTYEEWKKKFVDKFDGSLESFGDGSIIKPNDTKENFRSFSSGEEVNEFFYYDGEERGLKARKNSQYGQWVKNLPDENKAVIADYSTDAYDDINKYWRKISGWENIDAQKVKYQTQKIDESISTFELKDNIEVYRGVDLGVIADMFPDAEELKNVIGKVYRDQAFSSTTPILKVATKFAEQAGADGAVLKFDIPQGTGRGAYLDAISAYGESIVGQDDAEYEFLLKRDTKFEIYGVDESGTIPILKGRWIE